MFKKKRIVAIVYHYLPSLGGAERSLHRVLADLAAMGHECQAICFLDNFARPFRHKSVFTVDKVKVTQESFPVKNFLIESYVKQADVVFTLLHISPPVTEMALRSKKPVFHFVCDNSVLANPFIVKAMKASTLVYSNSEFMRDRILKLGIKSDVLLPSFNRECGAVPRTSDHILFVNPRPHKGHDIVKELIARFPDEKFIVVGDEKLDLVTGKQVELSTKENVSYVGSVDNRLKLDAFYCRSKAVLVPSQVPETFCMVAAEAVYRHVPVIASNIGALPETVGNCGVIVDDWNSVDAWENCFRDFLQEKKTYQFNELVARLTQGSDTEIVQRRLMEL